LDTHGLFRLSGNQLDINKWKDALSAHDGTKSSAVRCNYNVTHVDLRTHQLAGFVDFKKENVDVHVVACLLKEFIRSLPEPPVPFSLYDPLMDCMGTHSPLLLGAVVVMVLTNNPYLVQTCQAGEVTQCWLC